MRLLPYLGRRLLFAPLQVMGILLITFIFVRLIPGDPARLMAGPLMPEEGVELIRQRMGLTGPLPLQFMTYVGNVAHGDLGRSWYTGNPVATDIALRLPYTLELLILALVITFFVLLPLAMKTLFVRKGLVANIVRRGFFAYGMAAGAFPDFWLGLILIFVFYAMLGWAPAPVGQLALGIPIPARITGMYLIDSLLTGNYVAFMSSLRHLILPVFVLTFVYGGGIVKVGMVTVAALQKSEFTDYAKVCGLSKATIQRYLTKATYPPVASFATVTFAFLLGGAVLVETVFSWGGFGQYAVQSVVNADFAAIQGVVLVSALMNLVVYILVDLLFFWVDPRIKSLG